MMRFMLQTVQPLENAGFNTDGLRRPWCVMVLSDTYNDVRMSIFPSVRSEDPDATKALLNA